MYIGLGICCIFQERKRRQEELKMQLEAQLKQQQLQLKMAKKAQALREKESKKQKEAMNNADATADKFKPQQSKLAQVGHPATCFNSLDFHISPYPY